jgi:Glycosyl hydrolase family 85
VLMAGNRAGDVFHGVDVFGRGSYEGGQLNTWKAVEKCVSSGLSVALFAPGWSYENSGGVESYEAFRRTENALWNGHNMRVLSKYLKWDLISNQNGTTWEIINEKPKVYMYNPLLFR